MLAATFNSLEAQDPGERLVVRSVKFHGNDAIDDYTLAISIATSQSPWLKTSWLVRWLGLGTPRSFDELEFRRDVLRIQLLYRQHGYYEARVDTVVRRAADHIHVRFLIEEGPPIAVDTITIMRGDSAIRPRRLMSRLPLKEGRPLNRFFFDASADSILFASRERGFPFASVFRGYQVDRESREADVSYEVVTGPRARIGAIIVDSAAGIRPSLVRRFLHFSVGDVFSQSALYNSQRTLYRTDMFRYVSVGVAPDSLVDGVDSLVRIRVTVAEAPRARVRTGVGYGTIDCFRTQANATVANFAGGGRRLDLTGRLSKIGVGAPTKFGFEENVCGALREDDQFSSRLNHSASITVTQPSLFARRTAGSLTGFAERRSEFRAYETVRIGGAASYAVGSGLPPGIVATYRIANSRTLANAATFCVSFDRCDAAIVDILSRSKRQASLALALSDIHVNSPIDPTDGHALTADFMTAARVLYSQVVFSKVVGDATMYQPLARRWVLALRLRAGAIHTGVSTVAGEAIRFVPPEERFYLGGPSTVRGYGRNAMGPVVYVTSDSTSIRGPAGAPTACDGCRTSPLGASAMTLANAEIRAPSPIWSSRLRLALFLDAGQLWQQTDFQGLVSTGLRFTPGFGVRFGTALGPMRFDVGYSGYSGTCGPVYLVTGVDTTRTLENRGTLCPPLARGFLRRLQFHFSVGQAY